VTDGGGASIPRAVLAPAAAWFVVSSVTGAATMAIFFWEPWRATIIAPLLLGPAVLAFAWEPLRRERFALLIVLPLLAWLGAAAIVDFPLVWLDMNCGGVPWRSDVICGLFGR